MNNIALVGVPGSKKTSYARKLGLKVLDRVPQRFSKQTGVMVGTGATWYTNLVLAGLRLNEEYVHREEDFVSTTTVIDSLAYTVWGTYKYDEINIDLFDLEDLNKPFYMASLQLVRLLQEAWNFSSVVFFPYTGEEEWKQELNLIYSNILGDYFESTAVDSETTSES